MKKITNVLKNISLAMFSSVLLFSCSKDENTSPDTSAPTIEGVELGEANSKIGYIGDELHVEATLTAEGTIQQAKLQITYQNGESSFKIEEAFADFVGKKEEKYTNM